MRDILSKMKVADLKKEISKTNIKGYSKMKKSELIDVMMKNKEKFSHLSKAEPAKAKPAKAKRAKKPPLKKVKIVEEKPKKQLTMKEVDDSDAFDKSKYKDFYVDLVEGFIDGKGSEEKQLDRASSKAYSFIRRQTKKIAKKEKVTSVKELVDAINKLSYDEFLDF